jgi:hypothetical protein
MPTPTQINIAELDYDVILENLVAFMKTDPEFTDYDFAGSGLRLLSRVLAYVIFYQNYYLSAAVNESFLDTAQLRSSVASHARMLGYEISGTKSARLYANVAIQLENTDASTVMLPRLTQFTLSANSDIVFHNPDDEILTANTESGYYENQNVLLVEGTPLEYRFVVTTDPTQRFVIPNANIDYGTIRVTVQETENSNVYTTFNRATNYLTIGPNDAVFFVQESYDGYPELKFGNDVIGAALDVGNVIVAEYFISKGTGGNNVRGPFTIGDANITGFSRGATYADSNTEPSLGGTDAETLDNARFMAPLVYQAQNRCVTAEDYKAIILQEYGEHIAAINVFGGEEGNPLDPLNRPQFGHVYIVLKPKVGMKFTDTIRAFIENDIIKPHTVIGVLPSVIDPDYVYMRVITSVRYDPRQTTRTKIQLEQAVKDSVSAYAEEHIEKFDTSFRFSKFTRVIDDTDEAIVSSLTRVDLEKRIYPELGVSNQFTLKFGAPIRRTGAESVILEALSHRFDYTADVGGQTVPNCFLYEQLGIIYVAHRTNAGEIATITGSIGTVDVDTGLVILNNFAPLAIENGELDVRIEVVPAAFDFTPTLNQLFTLDDTDIQVQLLNDLTATLEDQQDFFAGGILP